MASLLQHIFAAGTFANALRIAHELRPTEDDLSTALLLYCRRNPLHKEYLSLFSTLRANFQELRITAAICLNPSFSIHILHWLLHKFPDADRTLYFKLYCRNRAFQLPVAACIARYADISDNKCLLFAIETNNEPLYNHLANILPQLPPRCLLHAAKHCSNNNILQSILRRTDNINEQDTNGFTALFYATKAQNKDYVETLLEAGASQDAPYNRLQSPLHCAAKAQNTEIADLLLLHGAPVNLLIDNQTPLHIAVLHNHTPLLQLLLDKYHADPNAHGQGNAPPLHYAIALKYLNTVQYLLNQGADPNKCCPNNYLASTPLFCATDAHSIASIHLLVVAGADIYLEYNGFCALQYARMQHSPSMLEAMLDAHTLYSPKFASITTTIHKAAKYGQHAVVMQLLTQGTPHNLRDQYQRTPLYYATRYGHTEIVELLLDCGADPRELCNNYHPPLHYAIKHKHTEIATILHNS